MSSPYDALFFVILVSFRETGQAQPALHLGLTACGTSVSGMATKSHFMVGPFLTTSAGTQAGGAATQSAPRGASHGGRTSEAPGVSYSQKDGDAEQADPVAHRPGPAVPAALAHVLH